MVERPPYHPKVEGSEGSGSFTAAIMGSEDRIKCIYNLVQGSGTMVEHALFLFL
jgi:hypothetical protein